MQGFPTRRHLRLPPMLRAVVTAVPTGEHTPFSLPDLRLMADSTSAVAGTPVSGEDLARAEKFTFEPFVHEGDDPAVVLAAGTPRRRALDDALAEVEAGLKQPSIQWRQKYSLLLGLERLMAQEEPKLADGTTTLNAHQVDALSGTMIALVSELLASEGAAPALPPVEEDEEDEDSDDEDFEDGDADEDDGDEDEEDDEDESDAADPEGSGDWGADGGLDGDPPLP